MSLSPYNFFNNISHEKHDVTQDDIFALKSFNSFVMLRVFSFHIDSILIAEKLNRLPNASNETVYKYLLARVRKKRRKWVYPKEDAITPDLELIMKHYDYSLEKAIEARKLLSEEFIAKIAESYDEGGFTKPKGKRKRKK